MKPEKLLSFLTAAVISVTCSMQNILMPVSAAQSGSGIAGFVSAEGSGQIGAMLAARVNQETSKLQYAEGCNIFSVRVAGVDAQIHFQTDQACRIVVGVYSDNGSQMYGSAIAEVRANQTEAAVHFNFKLPESFTVKAYMVGQQNTLLSEEYVNQNYTDEIRMLRNADINSFPKRHVLNLDDQPDTNFLVYNSTVTVLKQTETQNIISDAEADDGRYVIRNLSSGIVADDLVSVEDGSGGAVIFRVQSVETSDGITTVTADPELDVTEAFDYIKIEYQPHRVSGDFRSQDADTEPLPAAQLPHVSAQAEPDSADGEQWSFSASRQLESAIRSGLVSVPGLDSSDAEDVKFSSTVSAAFNFGFLKTPHHDSSYFYLDLDYALMLSINGRGEMYLPLLTGMMIPDIAGLRLNFGLYLKMKLDGKASGSMQLSTTLDETGFYPHADYDIQVNGNFSISVIARTNLTMPAGVKGSTELSLGLAATLNPTEPHPVCSDCYAGDISLECSAQTGFVFRTPDKPVRTVSNYIAPPKKLTDIYYSEAMGGFHFGVCPNRSASQTPLPATSDKGENSWTLNPAVPGDSEQENDVSEPDDGLTADQRALLVFTDAPAGGVAVSVNPARAEEIETIEIPAVYDGKPVTMIGTGKYAEAEDNAVTWSAEGRTADAGFEGCKRLRRITLPDSIAEIGAYAFAGCENLTEINLPDSVIRIGARAFSGCTGMQLAQLPADLRALGDYAFADCACALESPYFPPVLSDIGTGAFAGCTAIRQITLALRTVPAHCFEGCTALESVRLEAPLRSILTAAFRGCISLSDVTLPSTLHTIGQQAFENDTALTALRLPEKLRTLGVSALAGVPLKYVSIPAQLTQIPDGVFARNSVMREITLPETVREIDFGAFADTPKLAEIIVENRDAVLTLSAAAEIGGKCIRGWYGSTAQQFAETVQCIFEPLDQQKDAVPGEVITTDPPGSGSHWTNGDPPQTVTFRGLKPNTLYNFYNLLGDAFTEENLLYLSQGTANAEGSLTVWYCPVKDDVKALKCVRSFDVNEPAVTAVSVSVPVLCGDLNSDAQIDVSDAVLLARFCAEDSAALLDAQGKRNADCNHDGEITPDDVLMILRYISRIIDVL